MGLTRYEMETVINFNAEEAEAELYTCDKAVMRRLDRLVEQFPDMFQVIKQTESSKTYSFPKKFALPRRPRLVSEEQREQARERLMQARSAKENR